VNFEYLLQNGDRVVITHSWAVIHGQRGRVSGEPYVNHTGGLAVKVIPDGQSALFLFVKDVRLLTPAELLAEVAHEPR
jgi:hypothetical protein